MTDPGWESVVLPENQASGLESTKEESRNEAGVGGGVVGAAAGSLVSQGQELGFCPKPWESSVLEAPGQSRA